MAEVLHAALLMKLPTLPTANSTTLVIAALTALTWPLTAAAHPGHDSGVGFIAGFTHPLTGTDHLIVMLAVGVWAAQLGDRARVLLPASFLLCMLCGAALGLLRLRLPYSDAVIVVSVVVLLGYITFGVRMHALQGSALAGAFALFHGYAHAVEMPVDAAALRYMAGFAVATTAVQLAGLGLGSGVQRKLAAVRSPHVA
jgi:urease accessory protein